MGSYQFKTPDSARSFNFDRDIAYADKLLDVLDGLQKPNAAK